MTPIQVVAVCLRLLAVVWLLYALNHAHGVFGYLGADEAGLAISKPAIWALAIAQVAACAILWFFPVTIASKLLPAYARRTETEDAPRLDEWQALGLILIGLWGLCRAIPDAVYWLSFLTMSFSGDSKFGELAPDQKASVIATAVEILISAWVLLGAKGFAALLFKIRTAGVSK